MYDNNVLLSIYAVIFGTGLLFLTPAQNTSKTLHF